MIYPLYFIFGQDFKNIKKHICHLEKEILKEKILICETITFFLSEISWNNILAYINTESFFVGKKFIKIYDAHLINKNEFIKFFDQKTNFMNTILFFISYGDKIEKYFSLQVLELFKKYGTIYTEKKSYSNELINLLNTNLKSYQYVYSQELLVYLVQQLDGIEKNIPKIVNLIKEYYTKGSTLKLQDIQYLVRAEEIPSFFELIDQFFQKNWINALEHFILYQEKSISILFLFFRQIEIFYMIKDQVEKNIPQYEIFKTLKIHPFIGKKIIRQMNMWSFEELEKLYIHLTIVHEKLRISPPKLYEDLFQVYLFSFFNTE